MKDFIFAAVLMVFVAVWISLIAELHCRVIELETYAAELETRVERNTQALWDEERVVEITPSGYLKVPTEVADD